MKFTQFLPIPIVVFFMAFLWMVIAKNFNLLAWVAFLTWGAYFMSGITTKSAIREGIGFTLGIIFGAVIILLTTYLAPALGDYALPVVVGLAGFTIVLLELVPWVDMAPSYFIGAAAFFGAGGSPDVATFMAVFVPGMLGLAIGYVTAYLRGVVLKMEGVKDPLKAA